MLYEREKFLIGSAVKFIADKGMTDRIQMNPYLIGPTCFGDAAKKGSVFQITYFFKQSEGRFGKRGVFRNDLLTDRNMAFGIFANGARDLEFFLTFPHSV